MGYLSFYVKIPSKMYIKTDFEDVTWSIKKAKFFIFFYTKTDKTVCSSVLKEKIPTVDRRVTHRNKDLL